MPYEVPAMGAILDPQQPITNNPSVQKSLGGEIPTMQSLAPPPTGVGIAGGIVNKALQSDFGHAAMLRTTNMMKMLKTAFTFDSAKTPEDKKMVDMWNTGIDNKVEAFKNVETNLGKEYTAHDVLSGLSKVKDTVGGALSEHHDWSDLPGMTGKLLLMPIKMAYSIVADAGQAANPLDISGEEIKPADVDTQTHAIQSTLGNVVAAAVAPVVSEAMSAALSASTKLAADATLKQTVDVATKVPAIGAMGRAIISDVTAGGAAGASQGAVAAAGDPNMIANALTGLMFAPLGIITGWYRGFKGGGFDSVDRNIVTAKDISNLRQVQNVADASIVQLGKRAAQMLGWSDIGDIKNSIEGGPLTHTVSSGQFKGATFKATPSFTMNAPKGLAEKFFETHDPTKPFEPQIAKFLGDMDVAPEHMKDMRNAIASTMIQQYGDAHALNTIEGAKLLSESRNAVDIANEHGYYLDNEQGQIVIRDITNGMEINRASSAKQATDWIQKTGQGNGFNLDAHTNFPTDAVAPKGGIVVPPAGAHLVDNWRPIKGYNAANRNAAFDIRMGPLSATDAIVSGVDKLTSNTLNPTNIKQGIIEKLEPVRRQTEYFIRESLGSPRMNSIFNFARQVGKERLDHVGRATEMQNMEEMSEVGGFQKGMQIDLKGVNELAMHNTQNNVDWSRVLTYRRVMRTSEMMYQSIAYDKAIANYKVGKLNDIFTNEMLMSDLKKTEASYQQHPEFQEMMKQINASFSPDGVSIPDDNFLKAVSMADKMANSSVHGTTNLAAVGRFTQAMKYPEEMNLTQAQFMDKHNFTPIERKMVGSVTEAYNHFGKKYGIEDGRMFNRYLNHYRQYGDLLDTFGEDEFSRGISNKGVSRFASSMVRTGELEGYSTNPVETLTSYIRAGEKSISLYPQIDNLFNRKPDGRASVVEAELNKISNPSLRKSATDAINFYREGITGRPTDDAQLGNALEVYLQKNLGKTNPEIVAQLKGPKFIDTIANASGAGLIGGRIAISLKTRLGVWQKYYSTFGHQRFADLLTTRVPQSLIRDLVRRGEITDNTGQDFYNIGADPNAANSVMKELAQAGYEIGLHKRFYMQHQAAVYTAGERFVGKLANDFIDGKITKDELMKKVFINHYDVGTQREFNSVVSGNNANASQGARILARADVRDMVGTFGRGNQPAISNSAVGKLFGQLGSWSMANRSVMTRIGTQGTAGELAGVYTRYAASLAITKAVGAATGLNLGRFALVPTSLMFTGGPIIELLKNFKSLGEAMDDPDAMKYASRQLYRSSSQFIPFGYALQDVEKAMQLSVDGDGFGYGRIAAQAIGIPVAKDSRSLLDYVNGQYPLAPQHPEGVLEATGIPDFIDKLTNR